MNAPEPISWPVNIGSGGRLYALKQQAIIWAQKWPKSMSSYGINSLKLS